MTPTPRRLATHASILLLALFVSGFAVACAAADPGDSSTNDYDQSSAAASGDPFAEDACDGPALTRQDALAYFGPPPGAPTGTIATLRPYARSRDCSRTLGCGPWKAESNGLFIEGKPIVEASVSLTDTAHPTLYTTVSYGDASWYVVNGTSLLTVDRCQDEGHTADCEARHEGRWLQSRPVSLSSGISYEHFAGTMDGTRYVLTATQTRLCIKFRASDRFRAGDYGPMEHESYRESEGILIGALQPAHP